MRTSTTAQGPIRGVDGELITIGTTIYHMEAAMDYPNATGELRAFLDNRDRDAAADAALIERTEKLRAALRQKNGAPTVSVLQMRLAALAQARLTALDAAIAALPMTEFKVRWQCMDQTFTRADLGALVPGTLTTAQADALFTAARAAA